jgi:hypothetical protein
MNKKILPFFSLLVMFALALTSFAPAYAAQTIPPGNNSPVVRYEQPVKLSVVYNAATSQILLTASFIDKSLIKRGDVSVSKTKAWVKTTTLYNTNQITQKYAIPRGSVGVYCANVVLNGGEMPGVNPTPKMIQGSASKCIMIPPALQK